MNTSTQQKAVGSLIIGLQFFRNFLKLDSLSFGPNWSYTATILMLGLTSYELTRIFIQPLGQVHTGWKSVVRCQLTLVTCSRPGLGFLFRCCGSVPLSLTIMFCLSSLAPGCLSVPEQPTASWQSDRKRFLSLKVARWRHRLLYSLCT